MSGKSAVQSYRDLIVWRRGIELATAIYRLTCNFPREEMYGLSAQLRCAAISVPSNIAEGQGRLTTGEFRQFLGMARGSNFELQTQLEIARTLGFVDGARIDQAENLSNEIGKMISALLHATSTS
jgi:four helix bundle protein